MREVEPCASSAGGTSLAGVAVIMPALNEAENLRVLLPKLSAMGVGQILVCDNGSSDGTPAVAGDHGATHVLEPHRGYGAACYAGMQRLRDDITVVAFLDADRSDEISLLPALVQPILEDESDFVLTARVRRLRQHGAMTAPQAMANRLVPALVWLGWGHRYSDLGPFRAIRRSSLEAIDMQDRAFGWTIEMQIRAVELGLRIDEMPAPYYRRHGRSKISGTIRGVSKAAYWILSTCWSLWWTKGRRLR